MLIDNRTKEIERGGYERKHKRILTTGANGTTVRTRIISKFF